jgi:hypothetical protein
MLTYARKLTREIMELGKGQFEAILSSLPERVKQFRDAFALPGTISTTPAADSHVSNPHSCGAAQAWFGSACVAHARAGASRLRQQVTAL